MTIQCRSQWEADCVLPLGHEGEHKSFGEQAAEARLAEAERLLRIVDDAARHADMGRYWVGMYYDECEAIRAFVRPADSAGDGL